MPLGAFDPKWLPDGKRIAFGALLFSEAPTPEGTKDLADRRAKDPVKVHITSDRVYRYWDKWLTGGEVPHLFVLDLETRALTDLTPDGAGWFDFMEPGGQYDIARTARRSCSSRTRASRRTICSAGRCSPSRRAERDRSAA
jgi:Tol biopolymer transport system component